MSGEQKIIYTGPSPRGWHRLQQAAECMQKYAWMYEVPKSAKKKDESGKSPALAKGSLIHLALAQHYARMRNAQQGKDPEEYCEPAEAVQLISKLDGVEKFADVAIGAYKAYTMHYDEFIERQQMEIVAVEELMETQSAGRYLLTGRLDLAYRDLGGRVWVMDHKTTSRLTKSQKEYYTVSGQLLGYSHMAREKYGDQFAGLMVNLIQHGECKFQRIELPRSPNLESRFEQIVVDIEESIERMKISGRSYDEWPKSITELVCYHRYGACRFIDQCRFGAGSKHAGNWTWVGN